MIPKIIHWCFLTEPYPKLVEECLESWKKFCPDYVIKRWDLSNINFDELPKWCKVAYDNKLYAFVADYIRIKAVYEEGGIYLDSDVLICDYNIFDDYQFDKLWIPVEKVSSPKKLNYEGDTYFHGVGVNPVFFGAEPNHPLLEKLKKKYESFPINYPLIASMYHAPIAPCVWSNVLSKEGFQYVNKEVFLGNGIHILTNKLFNHLGVCKTKEGLKAVHMACNSWVRT